MRTAVGLALRTCTVIGLHPVREDAVDAGEMSFALRAIFV
jgi:hypothetical protein